MSIFKRAPAPQTRFVALRSETFGIGKTDIVLVKGEPIEIDDPNAAAILLEAGHIEVPDE